MSGSTTTLNYTGANIATFLQRQYTVSGYNNNSVSVSFSGSSLSVGSDATLSGAANGSFLYKGVIVYNMTDYPVFAVSTNYYILGNSIPDSSYMITATPLVACFARGTRIQTVDGPVEVERLAIGARVRTTAGAVRAIRWIGYRAYGRRFAASNPDITPVLIKAGALGDNQPRRDLYVSPLHAMFIDDVLVPARCLVNGSSIVQPEPGHVVEYYHIELDSHDVIFAEGAPAETYVNDGNRSMFQNAHEYAALYPDVVAGPACYCAERVESGPALDVIRARIDERARASGLAGPNTHSILLEDADVTRAMIPAWVEEIHLYCEAGRAGSDARVLGALLTGLSLDGQVIDLADRSLARGFHPVEQHGVHQVRWSSGDAVLRVSPAPHPRVLEVRVGGRFTLAAAA